MTDPIATFPHLFTIQHLSYADTDVRLTLDPVDDALVNRLHLIGVTAAGAVIVCRSDQGWRFLPGGTREPDESLAELAHRELREEAGATLLAPPTIFAAFLARSWAAEPYRPHLSHPYGAWAFGIAPVRLDGAPLNPPDGETVIEVLALPPTAAVRWLAEHDAMHADLLALALELGLVRPPS